MDREYLISILNDNKPDLGSILIKDYCLERGKDPDIVIKSLYHYISIMPYITANIIEYYKIKYNVGYVMDKDYNILIYF